MHARPARTTRDGVDAAIGRLARRQHGAFSRPQAERLGATRSMMATRIRAGRWERARPGVYVVAGVPPTWRQGLVAACLAYGGDAVVSHRAAAALWGFPGFAEGPVELTVPRARGRIASAVVHRPAVLTPRDRTEVGGIAVTTAERTLIDLAGLAPSRLLEDALDDALRRGLVTLSRLRRRAGALRRRGRPGSAMLRSILDARDSGPVPMSVLESALVRLLRRPALPAPVLQHPIKAGGRVVAIVDLAYPEQRVAVEADGRRWHATRTRWARDLARRNALTALGWRVVHVTWDDVTRRPRRTVATIARVLEASAR